MSVEGVDYSFDRPSSSQALRDAGKHFAARYLAIPPNGKIITRTEANSLAAAGVWSVVAWEQSGHGSVSPEDAARYALQQAADLGIPHGRPIYAAVDFDVQPSQFAQVKDWITRFHKALGGKYDGRALYGSYYIIKAGFDEGWLKWGWQCYAWSYGHRDDRAQLYQRLNGQTVAGCSVDLDTAYHSDYGQWMPGKLPDSADEGDEDVVKYANLADGKAARKDGLTLKAGTHTWLNTDADAPTTDGRSLVSTTPGYFEFVIHVYAQGNPGDALDIQLYREIGGDTANKSPHYVERVTVDPHGWVRVNVPFARFINDSIRVFLRLQAAPENKKDVKVTLFDVDVIYNKVAS